MKLIPASSAPWMIRIESSWSGLPHAPNIIAPRQSGLTWRPVRPSGRWSTSGPYAIPRLLPEVAAQEFGRVLDAERPLPARPLVGAARVDEERRRDVGRAQRAVERQRLGERDRIGRAA